MPFRSKAQQRYMFAKHPALAKRWEDRFGIPKNLPEHVSHRREALKRRARG
jgi:hypothetical protein